jgi:D-arabinose 1-dehydrogenase-like Zn-dependent alcohol dehydrogenase
MENLCDRPTFTGYSVNGGYAEYVSVRADFTYPLSPGLDPTHVAPLLCAGMIGFRRGERQIRSVANMTRSDGRDFLKLAEELRLAPEVTVFSLAEANAALQSVKDETEKGSAVIVP